MYAAIRQGKAKTGMAEELARRIKEGAIPIISDVEGFMAYYVVYAPDDTVTAISLFNNYAGAEEANTRALAWTGQDFRPRRAAPPPAVPGPVLDRARSCAPAGRPSHRGGRPGDRAYVGIASRWHSKSVVYSVFERSG